MNNIKAYGAGLAGGQFDKNTFFKKPTVIFKCGGLVRILSFFPELNFPDIRSHSMVLHF